jgi:hypothetical protein
MALNGRAAVPLEGPAGVYSRDHSDYLFWPAHGIQLDPIIVAMLVSSLHVTDL